MRIKYVKPPPNQMDFDFTYDFDVIEEDVFINGNIQSIRNMLPYLYLDQHEDVSFAVNEYVFFYYIKVIREIKSHLIWWWLDVLNSHCWLCIN